jgi:hypothetical protein
MRKFNYKLLKVLMLIALAFCLHSCGQMSIPQELVGHWTTQKHLITVRTKSGANWHFTSDSASITFKINNDYIVAGSIGSAKFENGKIRLNWLLPVKMTRQAFKIKCGRIGKIFENDPLVLKKVELWLSPIHGNTIDADLRQTEGWSLFPMGGAIFTKEDD